MSEARTQGSPTLIVYYANPDTAAPEEQHYCIRVGAGSHPQTIYARHMKIEALIIVTVDERLGDGRTVSGFQCFGITSRKGDTVFIRAAT